MSEDGEAVEISRTAMIPMYDFCGAIRDLMKRAADKDYDDEELRQQWIEVIQERHKGLAFLPTLIPPPSRKIVKEPLSSEQD